MRGALTQSEKEAMSSEDMAMRHGGILSHLSDCLLLGHGVQEQWFLIPPSELLLLHLLYCYRGMSSATIPQSFSLPNLYFPSCFHICVSPYASINFLIPVMFRVVLFFHPNSNLYIRVPWYLV